MAHKFLDYIVYPIMQLDLKRGIFRRYYHFASAVMYLVLKLEYSSLRDKSMKITLQLSCVYFHAFW